MSSGGGFDEISQSDLKDPTLWKINEDFKHLFSKINGIYGPGSPALQSSPTLATAFSSQQKDIKALKPTEFITKGLADQLYGAAVIQQALTTGVAPGSTPTGTTIIQQITQQGGGGLGTNGTHAARPLPANVANGTFYFETDRTVLYQNLLISNVATWVLVAGGMVGLLAALPGGLGVNDKGFLFYATDYYHLYQWDGAVWTFAPGTESSGIIVMAGPVAPPHPNAAWKLCNGSPATLATPTGALVTVTTPNSTSSPFLRFGSYTGSLVTATPGTLTTGVTVAVGVSIAPGYSGVVGTTGNDSASQVVLTGIGTTVAAHPHTHSIGESPHFHTATTTVTTTQPTLAPPSDVNGGLPANMAFALYIRI